MEYNEAGGEFRQCNASFIRGSDDPSMQEGTELTILPPTSQTGSVGGLDDGIMCECEWFGCKVNQGAVAGQFNLVGRHVQKERMPSCSASASEQSCFVLSI